MPTDFANSLLLLATGVGGAAAGTLTFMVGGTPTGFARAQTVLACMGKNLVHCGAGGTGQVRGRVVSGPR